MIPRMRFCFRTRIEPFSRTGRVNRGERSVHLQAEQIRQKYAGFDLFSVHGFINYTIGESDESTGEDLAEGKAVRAFGKSPIKYH